MSSKTYNVTKLEQLLSTAGSQGQVLNLPGFLPHIVFSLLILLIVSIFFLPQRDSRREPKRRLPGKEGVWGGKLQRVSGLRLVGERPQTNSISLAKWTLFTTIIFFYHLLTINPCMDQDLRNTRRAFVHTSMVQVQSSISLVFWSRIHGLFPPLTIHSLLSFNPLLSRLRNRSVTLGQKKRNSREKKKERTDLWIPLWSAHSLFHPPCRIYPSLSRAVRL